MGEITIVSAFMHNVNGNRNTDIYVEAGKQLLKINFNKLIFIEKEIYMKYKLFNYENERTKFIFFEKENLEFNDLSKYKNFDLITDNPRKDTLNYTITINNKINWVYNSSIINPFNSNYFIWIDFGIYILLNKEWEDVLNKLESIRHYQTDDNRVRIACSYSVLLNRERTDEDYCKKICWDFLGGVFGGNPESLKRFYYLSKEKCNYIMNTYFTMPWEVNIWAMLKRDNDDLFNCYISDHNLSIITNF